MMDSERDGEWFDDDDDDDDIVMVRIK